jgi:hypothetical protein
VRWLPRSRRHTRVCRRLPATGRRGRSNTARLVELRSRVPARILARPRPGRVGAGECRLKAPPQAHLDQGEDGALPRLHRVLSLKLHIRGRPARSQVLPYGSPSEAASDRLRAGCFRPNLGRVPTPRYWSQGKGGTAAALRAGWIEDSWCPCVPSVCRSTTRASLSERTLRGCNSDRRRRGRTRTVACCSEAGDAPAIAALERTTTRYVGRWPVLPIFGVASCRGLAVRRARTNFGDAPEQPSSRAGSESRALAGVHVPAGERGVRHKPSRVEVSRKRYHFSALFRLTNQDNQWRTRGGFGSRAKRGRTITSLRPQPFLLASRPGGRIFARGPRKGGFFTGAGGWAVCDVDPLQL